MADAHIYWDIGVKNLSYIVYTRTHEILAWDVVDTGARGKCGMTHLVKTLKLFLDTFVATDTFTSYRGRIRRCIIENQPTMNPLMRVVSGIVATYFYTKCGWEPLFFNPAYKLMNVDIGNAFAVAGLESPPEDVRITKGGKGRRPRKRTPEYATAYRLRKRASVEETRRVLQETPAYAPWLVVFERHKRKQDDLADTFLMARAHERAPMTQEIHVEENPEWLEEEEDDDASAASSEAAEVAEETCPFVQITQAPAPMKKRVFADDFPHYKFCIEDRLQKEYGKGKQLGETIADIIKTSRCKGIVALRERLDGWVCTCAQPQECVGRAGVFAWMLHEPHWKIMFR